MGISNTQAYRKTEKGVLTNLYSKMKERNRNKGFGDLTFSLKDLHETYLKDTAYVKLFKNWIDSGCDKNLKPSFDRINPKIGYTLENIKLLTWGENRKKADWEKSFIYTTPVIMYDINGNFIREFGSTKEANMITGIRQSGITSCYQGRYKHTGGYIFKYRGDKFRRKKNKIKYEHLLKE